MPSTCCIVHCKSGWKYHTEKVSFFSFPKDKDLEDKWMKAIPRANFVIGPSTVVCEKHFHKDQIIRTWESGIGPNKIVINLKRVRLVKDAIPSIFPGPKCSSKCIEKQNSRTENTLQFDSETIEQVQDLNIEATTHIFSESNYFSNPDQNENPPAKNMLQFDSKTNEQINLKRARLVKDAIPSIFPGPKRSSKCIEKQNSSTENTLQFDSETIEQVQDLDIEATTYIFSESDYFSNPDQNENPPAKNMLQFDSKTNEQIKEVNVESAPCIFAQNLMPDNEVKADYCSGVIFAKIFENPTATITLPKGWEYKTNSGKCPFITFYCMVPCNDKTFGFLIEKQLSFGKTMAITCKIYNKIFDLQNVGICVPSLPSAENVTNIIHLLNNYIVCIGGPLKTRYLGIQNSTTSIGPNGRLRHKQCPYLLDCKESQRQSCSHCLNIGSALRMKRKRMKDGKKCRLLLTPSQNQKLISLRKEKHSIQKKLLRSKFRLKKLEAELHVAKESLNTLSYNLNENVIIKYKMNDSQTTMIKEIITASKYENPQNRRYSENWLLLLLLFYIRFSDTYKLIRHQNHKLLPCVKTIRSYMTLVKTDFGFDDSFFKLLKKRMSMKTKKQCHGILLFNEVQLRKGPNVNTRDLSHSELKGIGDEITTLEENADHGLVFMFQSLADQFSQPVAVFASCGTVSGTLQAQLILKAIILLENSGCLIDGIICDGASTNRKIWVELGISGHLNAVKNYFTHPLNDNRKVYAFSDVPHLFKDIRNRLHDKDFLRVNPDGNPIKWNHYINVYNADIIRDDAVKTVPKLTKDHLFLSNFKKMSVRLMSQVFSHSMASGIEFYQKRNFPNFEDSDETIKWTMFLNNLFDAMNRHCTADGIRKFSHDLTVMEDAETWLNSWENCLHEQRIHKSEFLTMPTAEGLRVTLRSTIELSNYLLLYCGFQSNILTGKMNQDPLEKFFAMIRLAARSNDQSTGPTFLHFYRILSLYSSIKPPKYGICKTLDNQTQISVNKINKTFHVSNDYIKEKKLKDFQSMINMLVEDDQCQADDIFENHYNGTKAIDCIVYYACNLWDSL